MTQRFRFDEFVTLLPPDYPSRPGDDVADRYADRVPEELTSFWRKYGLRSFGDRLLWFFDPSWLEHLTVRFDGARDHIPFARTAFGSFFSVKDDEVFLTDPQYNTSARCSIRFDIFGFNNFRSAEKIENLLSKSVKILCEKRCGHLDERQCYGYRQALALGGEESMENTKVVDLEVYLEFLASLHNS